MSLGIFRGVHLNDGGDLCARFVPVDFEAKPIMLTVAQCRARKGTEDEAADRELDAAVAELTRPKWLKWQREKAARK